MHATFDHLVGTSRPISDHSRNGLVRVFNAVAGVKPLYAVAGATELAYQYATGYATEAQKTAQERFAEVQKSVSKLDPRTISGVAIGRKISPLMAPRARNW